MPVFSDLPLHPLVADAISKKGFETATPVQAAVLAAENAGRDLLVSSQTGSGKTLAFALSLANELLGAPQDEVSSDGTDNAEEGATSSEAKNSGRPAKLPAGNPRALVVAPTRELANQVGRELDWIFAEARLRIASITGGTPVVGNLKTLRGRVDVVVGTPGRLVDLHKRGALKLGETSALVLDEADEMLDMGFQEDLEYLLAQAKEERRTLLFSATMPPVIARMAKKYQNNAIRIDTRDAGGKNAHNDITYRAHLVRQDDRLGGVINLLLCGDPTSKTIVFCRTRDRVAGLHQHLVRAGIKTSAIAGDRSQAERDRALESLRNGHVQVMVATDVAARGLDLPDVERVIHGDLPENRESLAHRSGRTGRAGKKGTSYVLAEPRERRKAERLLQGVGIRAAWTPIPDKNAVARHAEELLFANLVQASGAMEKPVETPDSPEPVEGEAPNTDTDQVAASSLPSADLPPPMSPLHEKLRGQMDDQTLLQLLLDREAARMPTGFDIKPLEGKDNAKGPKTQRADMEDPVVFQISVGHMHRADARWLLPTICRRGNVTKNEIGAIRIGKNASVFEIRKDAADFFEKAAKRPDRKNPRVTIRRAGEGSAEDFAGPLRAQGSVPQNGGNAGGGRPSPAPKNKGKAEKKRPENAPVPRVDAADGVAVQSQRDIPAPPEAPTPAVTSDDVEVAAPAVTETAKPAAEAISAAVGESTAQQPAAATEPLQRRRRRRLQPPRRPNP